MAILDLQRRLAEVGRIRIGQQVPAGKGTRPTKLDTFRLTSADRNRIENAARLYGGTPREWEAPAGHQWEVVTDRDVLEVVVPPSDMAFSQYYELWSGGGCQRRCDGVVDSISEGPCVCDPENRECKIHTRLSVMLRDLPGLGVWRIDTSGYYAGVELQGAVEVVKLAAGRGQMLPASLRLEQRQIKRANEQTKRFAVPVLDLAISPAQLLAGGDPLDAGTLAVEPPRALNGTRHLTPVPDTVPEEPVPSIAEQATAEKPKRKPRKNAAQKLPETGIEPRTAQDARQSDNTDANTEQRSERRSKLNAHMHALFNDAGIRERDKRMTITRYVSKQFHINSSNDLTDDALSDVVTELQALRHGERPGDNSKLVAECQEILNQAAIDQAREQEGQE